MKRLFIVLCASMILAGCASASHKQKESLSYQKATHGESRITKVIVGDKEIGEIKALPPVKAKSSSQFAAKKLVKKKLIKDRMMYGFSAKAQDIRIALSAFAEKYNLNIIIDKEVKGEVTVSFNNVTLREALDSILNSSGYYAVFSGNIIKVKDIETRIFHVNYMNNSRGGNGTSSATMTSSSGSAAGASGASSGTTGYSSGTSGTSGGAGGDSSSGININSQTNISYFQSLENEIKRLLSDRDGFKGSVVVNSLSGTIVVTDRHKNIENIEKYIRYTEEALHRQVVLVVRIVDFSKNDGERLGIDWERLTNTIALKTTTALGNLATGGGAGILGLSSANSTDLTLSNNGNTFKAIISAMREQGNVELISSPQIRTLNNQPAMIKVGTDRTFFRIETNTSNNAGGSTVTTNDVPQTITIGFIMSIIPQISEDGKIIMDISPVMTALNGVDTSAKGSTAPVLDIKQISSVVRVNNGETVVVGGLVQTQNSDIDRSVPFFGKIPFISSFFKTTESLKNDKDLVIFITPYIIH